MPENPVNRTGFSAVRCVVFGGEALWHFAVAVNASAGHSAGKPLSSGFPAEHRAEG